MKQYNLIIPIGLKPEPDKYEKAVARLCAEKFQSDILFVKRGVATTPDIQVVRTGQFWEIKNIKGNGRHTIEDNLRKASKQSSNVIITLLATSKLDSRRVAQRIGFILNTKRMPLKHVLLITKSDRIIDII